MKILVAPDKFKGSLSSTQVCQAIIEGIQWYNPAIEAIGFPLADGGEGTAEILTYHAGGHMLSHTVQDPLFRPVKASFGLAADGLTAFLEMAQASGLHLLAHAERNGFLTSSIGTGELILKAVERGARRIILGIGGSATNDAGIGMATALGYRFLDAAGKELKPIGSSLIHIAHIDHQHLHFDPAKIEVQVACDVNNPLTGSLGASLVYGPQKGANAEEVTQLEAGMKNLAAVIRRQFGKDIENVPGAGAAGGMGAGAMVFLHAALLPGTALVIEQTGFDQQLAGVDLIITGEGKMDEQTLHGKLVKGVVDMAALHGIPVVAIGGDLSLSPQEVSDLGLVFAGSVLQRPCSLEEAMQTAYPAIRNLTYHVLKLYLEGYKKGLANRIK
ncbi:MAG: glycerate kinase [Bacteroidota bacterium]